MQSISAFLLMAFLAAAPAPVTVKIKNMSFAPQSISVVHGGTITWKNDDVVPHTVTAADGSWGSPVIQPGATFRKKFTKKGKVQIVCTPHPTMKSTVIVK